MDPHADPYGNLHCIGDHIMICSRTKTGNPVTRCVKPYDLDKALADGSHPGGCRDSCPSGCKGEKGDQGPEGEPASIDLVTDWSPNSLASSVNVRSFNGDATYQVSADVVVLDITFNAAFYPNSAVQLHFDLPFQADPKGRFGGSGAFGVESATPLVVTRSPGGGKVIFSVRTNVSSSGHIRVVYQRIAINEPPAEGDGDGDGDGGGDGDGDGDGDGTQS